MDSPVFFKHNLPLQAAEHDAEQRLPGIPAETAGSGLERDLRRVCFSFWRPYGVAEYGQFVCLLVNLLHQDLFEIAWVS